MILWPLANLAAVIFVVSLIKTVEMVINSVRVDENW